MCIRDRYYNDGFCSYLEVKWFWWLVLFRQRLVNFVTVFHYYGGGCCPYWRSSNPTINNTLPILHTNHESFGIWFFLISTSTVFLKVIPFFFKKLVIVTYWRLLLKKNEKWTLKLNVVDGGVLWEAVVLAVCISKTVTLIFYEKHVKWNVIVVAMFQSCKWRWRTVMENSELLEFEVVSQSFSYWLEVIKERVLSELKTSPNEPERLCQHLVRNFIMFFLRKEFQLPLFQFSQLRV